MDNNKLIEKLSSFASNPELTTLETLAEIEDALQTVGQTFASLDINALEQIKGEKGDKGDKGDQGEPGRDGIDGIDGVDGKDGRDGQDGVDGMDADPEVVAGIVLEKIKLPEHKPELETPETIREKLKTLQGEERLPITAVAGFTERYYEMESRFSDALNRVMMTSRTRITAGANILVTEDGNGGYVITGSGGGGGSLSDGDKGDITVSSLGTVWTIDNDVVTYAKMQNVSATSRLLGRISSGAGDVEELTGTQATTLLDTFTSSLKGLVPASGGGTANFLRADGTWAAPSGSGTVTSVAVSGGTTGLTTSGGPITTSGTLTLGGTLVTANGGTGLTSIGTANQVLGVNNGATGLEYKTITAGTNVTVTHGANSITIAATGGGGMAIGGSITSATQGSVLFAGASGVLAQDNANFFWDDTNNRLGLGTSSPAQQLHLGGNGLLARFGDSNGGAITFSDPTAVALGFVGTYAGGGLPTLYLSDNIYWTGSAFTRGNTSYNNTVILVQNGVSFYNGTTSLATNPTFYQTRLGDTALGAAGASIATPFATLAVVGTAAGTKTSVIRAAGSQTANILELQNSATTTLAAFDKDGFLTLGLAGTSTGKLNFAGSTSGTVTVQTAAAAGTWTMTLPTSAGTNGYVLQTDGTGVTSWVAAGSGTMAIGGAVTSGTSGSILFVDGSGNLAQDNGNLFYDNTNDRLGLGTASPATRLHTYINDAATNATTDLFTLTHDSSGTPAANFGTGVLFQLESTTTAAQDASRISTIWTTATHASRTAAITLNTVVSGSMVEVGRLFNSSTDSALQLGTAGTRRGTMILSGASSGQVTIQARDAAGTSIFELGSNNSITSTSIGNNASSAGTEQVVVGYFASATANAAIAIGSAGQTTAARSIGIGRGFSVANTDAAAFGFSATSSASNEFTWTGYNNGASLSTTTPVIWRHTGTSSTTAGRNMSLIRSYWTNATDASRVSKLELATYTTTTVDIGLTITNTQVVVNATSVDASAQLQVDSTTRGFLPPRMTTTQRDAISSPANGLVLYNSTTNKLTGRENGAWVEYGTGGSSGYTISNKTSNYTETATSGEIVLTCDASSAAFTVTLATTASNTSKVTIKKVDSSANTITIDGNGTQTIDGALTIQLAAQYESVTLVTDGSNWFII